MTAARQQRKSRAWPLGWRSGLPLCGGIFAAPALLAAPNDRIVVNANSGLAISGFDPVAYFTERQAETRPARTWN